MEIFFLIKMRSCLIQTTADPEFLIKSFKRSEKYNLPPGEPFDILNKPLNFTPVGWAVPTLQYRVIEETFLFEKKKK